MIIDNKILYLYERRNHPDILNSELYSVLEEAYNSEFQYNLVSIIELILKQKDDELLNQFIKLYSTKEKHTIEWWTSYRKISLYKLIKETGLTKGTLYNIKNGESNPKYDTLMRICNVLNIGIEELDIIVNTEQKKE